MRIVDIVRATAEGRGEGGEEECTRGAEEVQGILRSVKVPAVNIGFVGQVHCAR